MPRRRSQVTGGRQIAQVLRKLPERMGRRGVEAGLRAGAQVVRREALRNLAGVVDDANRYGAGPNQAVIVRKGRIQPVGRSFVRVGISRDYFYLLFREFGTDPHEIAPRKARHGGRQRRVLASAEGRVYGPVIAHPGQAPRPWFRPAWESKKREALEKFRQIMARALKREAERLAGPLAKSGLVKRRRRRRRRRR